MAYDIKIPANETGRDWQKYAERTANYAFGVAGDVALREYEGYHEHWHRIEHGKLQEKSKQQEKKLMNDFEKIAFAGLEHDQYNILWVRHTHANHHELHFVIPRMELSTGKAFNPCPPNWQKHFDPLRDLLVAPLPIPR